MSLPHGGTVRKSRFVPAARERVFRAWTSERELAAWWRPGGYRAESVAIDLRVGGAYRICMVNSADQRQKLSGVFVVVTPPERLVMTWRLEGSPEDDEYEALLTLEFNEVDGGTRLELLHERLRPGGVRMFEAGWTALLATLAAQLAIRQETRA